jgi:translation initiation factor IF-2
VFLLKIRIFSLAKELGLDSKVLIEACQKLGIELKSSALASISPEERDQVLAHLKSGGGKPQEASSAPEPAAPVRESTARATRMATVKPIVIRTPTRREMEAAAAAASSAATAVSTGASTAIETVETETSAPPVVTRTTVASSTATLEPPVAEEPVSAESVSEVVVTPPSELETGEPQSDQSAVSVDVPEQPDSVPPGAAPLRREDYIPVAGGRGMRTMVARETMTDLGSRSAKNKKARPAPTLPTLAEAPPLPKSAQPAPEAPAQKPDLRLPKDIIMDARKPLTEHLRQHALDKKGTPAGNRKSTADISSLIEEVERRGKGAKAGATPSSGLSLQEERRARQSRRSRDTVEEASGAAAKSRTIRLRGKRAQQATQLKSEATVEFPLTVRTLSEAMGRPATMLVGILMRRGQMATVNSTLDEETATELALECGVDLHFKRKRDMEQELDERLSRPVDVERSVTRPPIVTILGHVDHGKTTLLDKIRSTNVAAGEHGGITQHIRAYQVTHNGHPITFLDTPGHAAFSEMRARGAHCTDIAVLVVASNDGVMPQTIEALNHIKAANVPIVVAMNKCDLPDGNEQRVLQDLAAQNVLAAEWGGDTEVVRTSGLTGQGIDDLLETLLTVAELRELRGEPEIPAQGVCIEAFRDQGRGVLAWVIVQQGTLRKGDYVLCGEAHGRIRAIYDDRDREVEEAGPSSPVRIAGLDVVPWAGDRFFVLDAVDDAREIAEERRERSRQEEIARRGKVRTLSDILSEGAAGEVQDLFLIIKADTPGSVEALKSELNRFQHPEVKVTILHDGVGGVNESDVSLAAASEAIVVAFHVVPEDRAKTLAERQGVEIREYGIIYEVTDDIKAAVEGMLRPEKVEVPTGRAIVLQTFSISRFGTIAGCRVLNGNIERNNRVRLIRDSRVLNEYNIQSLRRNKDDVKEVREGLECGIRLENFDDVKEGDILQAFRVDEVKRKLE